MTAHYWTCHWRFQFWNGDDNAEYEPVYFSGSNQLRERGVRRGDYIYVVSLSEGRLYLGGRMLVDDIVSRDQAVRLTGEPSLYDAREWAIGSKANGTPINFRRRLDPLLARRILFVSPSGPPKPLCFVNDTDLDVQTTRGVRRLTRESAVLFDRLIEVTDSLPPTKRVLTATAAHLAPADSAPDVADPVKRR